MVYRGHIKEGVVVFDAPADLAEGTEVTVQPVALKSDTNGSTSAVTEKIATENEGLARFAGCAPDLPEDAARNLDHYLYGHAKRE